MYRKTPKSSDTQKFAVITLKFEQGCFTIDADGMANSLDADQTAPVGAV